MFTLLINYTKPLAEVDRFRASHIEFVKEYYDKGLFIACGRQEPNDDGVVEGGMIWAQGVSRAEIKSIIAQDPYVTENVAEYKIVEFKPIKINELLSGFC